MPTSLTIASIALLMIKLAAQAPAADGMARGDVRAFGAVGDGVADDTVADMVVAGEIHLGADTAGVVLNACQIERGVRLTGGRGNVLNTLSTGEVSAQGGTGHVIRTCYIDLGRASSAVTFDFDTPHAADARIDSCIFRSNGTFRTSRARSEDFATNPEAVKNGVPMEVKEAIPEVFVSNACNVSITNNVFDSPAPPAPAFSFAPNQLAGAPWHRPGDPNRAVNGHLDESFGQRERWPHLSQNLKAHHGAFGIPAAEIGHLHHSAGLLPLLRSEGIAVSVEVPAWTQPLDASQLARAEILGAAIDGVNIFSSVFRIDAPQDRPDPLGNGWFVTRDRTPLIPDEIVLDERIPNLLPEFDAALLAQTQGSWDERKQAARKLSPFTAARQPYDRLLGSLMQDYVRYLEVARGHWGDRMPAVSLHWNVNPGWEWRDEKGLDAMHAANPAWCRTPEDFHRIVFTSPQYNSVCYLEQLLDVLGAAGFKPRTVFMDVDWNYSLPYVTEVLRRHKTSLAGRGVQMGINVVEAGLGEQEELVYDGHTLSRRVDPTTPPNVLYENTLVAIMAYLRGSGLYEPGMQIRVGSWSRRPAETGAEVDEATPGSLAHAANRIIAPP